MKMKTNKDNVLQQIHKEKLALKQSYLLEEEKIANNFDYLQDNWGTLLIHSALNGVKGFMGFPTNNSSSKGDDYQTDKIQQISSIGMNVIPMLWNIIQPFALKYGINKIKSFFTKKKKKKKTEE